jgi:hypothetical protein
LVRALAALQDDQQLRDVCEQAAHVAHALDAEPATREAAAVLLNTLGESLTGVGLMREGGVCLDRAVEILTALEEVR